MQLAMDDACITPDQVRHINAHGTSTAYNDKFETMAIKKVFGEHASDLRISSTKVSASAAALPSLCVSSHIELSR